MKELVVILLLVSRLGSLAQEADNLPAPPKEVLCGFQGSYFSLDADKIKRGMSVNLLVGDTPLGLPVKLRFFVSQKPGDSPVDALQVEHEKLMHIVGIRDDLKEFFHIHPLRVGPGLWLVTHTFNHGGNYKIWADVKYEGTSYSFAQPVLSISGALGEVENSQSPTDTDVRSGYRIRLRDAGSLVAGKTNQLQFSIQDAKGRETRTENFLGAPMHLVIVKNDSSVYLHAHPEHVVEAEPSIRFRQVFPQAGTYKLFAQFRPTGTKLPRDEALLAEFYVNVAAKESNSMAPATK